jgi:hypothetical protein
MAPARTPLDMLTTEQAFKAMVIYLEGVYARTKSDDVAGLLGDLLMGDDGTTASRTVQGDLKIGKTLNTPHVNIR